MLPDNRSLTPEERRTLQETLSKVFDLDDFDMMLLNRTNKRREDLTTARTFPKIISDVIVKFEQMEEVPVLLKAALEERPNNQILLNLSQKFEADLQTEGSSIGQPKLEEVLQRRVSQLHSSFNASEWTKRLLRLQRQVCCIVVTSGRTASYG